MHFLISWFLWLKVIPKVRTFKPFLDLPRVDSALTQSFNPVQKQFHPGPLLALDGPPFITTCKFFSVLGRSPRTPGERLCSTSLPCSVPFWVSFLHSVAFNALILLQAKVLPEHPPPTVLSRAGKTWQTMGFASFCISPP